MRRRFALALAACLAGFMFLAGAIPAAPPAAPPITAQGLQLPSGTFEIVPRESSVTFFVPDNRGGFTGHTTQVTGCVMIEPQEPYRHAPGSGFTRSPRRSRGGSRSGMSSGTRRSPQQ